MTLSEPSSLTSASSRYPYISEVKDSALQLYMNMIEVIKGEMNGSLKAYRKNTVKQVDVFKDETNKYKEIQE